MFMHCRYFMVLDGKHTNLKKIMLTLHTAIQWDIMETRRGEDLCHFLGKPKQKQKPFDNSVVLKLGDNTDIRKHTPH